MDLRCEMRKGEMGGGIDRNKNGWFEKTKNDKKNQINSLFSKPSAATI